MTNLDGFWTLLLSWVVAPGLVALVATGLGLGLARVTGIRLGALTLPAGFTAGMGIMGSLLVLDIDGRRVVAVTALLAVAGAVAAWFERGRPGLRTPLVDRRASGGLRRSDALWGALAGLAGFLVGIAPNIGSGHAGITGYILNNDPSVHIAMVQLLADHGAHVLPQDSSYAMVAAQFGYGYPLGSYAWPLVASVLAVTDPFLVWTPVIALSAGAAAMAAFALARRLGAIAPLAALGGMLVACGYLPFSYLVQGGLKEIMLATGVLTTVALAARALDGGLTARRAVAPAASLAGAVTCFGVGSLSSLGPALLLVGLIGLQRAHGRRVRAAVGLAGGGLVAFVLAAPAVFASLHFTEVTTRLTQDPNALGNLVTAVPWRETFNVWFAGDYRNPLPDAPALTSAGIVLAGALAVVGLLWSLRRREWAVPALVIGSAIAAWYVARRYATYFEAKIYVTLGLALGMATVAGIVALAQHRRLRLLGFGLGAVWMLMLAASDFAVYRQVWLTPVGRFEEMSAIDHRFARQGPMLVVEREDYAKYLLRDVTPWESWGVWSPDIGLRAGYRIPAPHTPDLDDYRWDFMQRFPLLLERRRPGGSAPPEGYSLVEQTAHYRVWRRTSALAKNHLSLGTDTIAGTSTMDCSSPEGQAFLTASRGRTLRASTGPSTLFSIPAWQWDFLPPAEGGPTADFVFRRGGIGFTRERLPGGHYVAWIQGEFSSGVRLLANGRPVGDARADQGLFDQWHRLGEVRVPAGGATPRLAGLPTQIWQAGMRRPDLTGPVLLQPVGQRHHLIRVPPSRHRSLCGRNLDWVEYY